jgi:hypothetical protein
MLNINQAFINQYMTKSEEALSADYFQSCLHPLNVSQDFGVIIDLILDLGLLVAVIEVLSHRVFHFQVVLQIVVGSTGSLAVLFEGRLVVVVS